ncbi:MAG: hypothetical protein KF702_08310, partial [Gammaproteobacteria bacterium]|nr:hypothetical protein [Gammaproteobacteria bacterium]
MFNQSNEKVTQAPISESVNRSTDGFLLTEEERETVHKLFEEKGKKRLKERFKERKKRIKEKIKGIAKEEKVDNDPNPNRVTLYCVRNGERTKFAILQFEHPNTKELRRFVVLKKLGQGGSGKVKLMQDLETGEWMALKIMTMMADGVTSEHEKEKNNLVQFQRSCGGFHQKANLPKENKKGEPAWTKAKYFLAMELAPGIDLNKKLVQQEVIKIYSHANIFQAACDNYTAIDDNNKVDKDQKEGFLKAWHVIPVEGQPTKLKVVYFLGNEQKERIFDKNEFIKQCQSASHLNDVDFPKMFNPERLAKSTQVIHDVEDKQLFGELKRTMGCGSAAVVDNQRPLEKEEVANISLLMVQEVKNLHDKGLCHRDIKPEQFIYDESEGKVSLIDLGSAVLMDEEANAIIGTTLFFLAPEILKKSKVNDLKATIKRLYEEYKREGGKGFPKREKPIGDLAEFEKCHKKWMRNKEERDYKQKFEKAQEEVKEENRSAKFTEASEIYALGLSIGQIFLLTERRGIGEAFNLSKPEYFVDGVTELEGQVLVIKSLEDAKKNNLYRLHDEDLSNLVDMLQRMTDQKPENRPNMGAVKAFFEGFSKKLQNAEAAAPAVVPQPEKTASVSTHAKLHVWMAPKKPGEQKLQQPNPVRRKRPKLSDVIGQQGKGGVKTKDRSNAISTQPTIEKGSETKEMQTRDRSNAINTQPTIRKESKTKEEAVLEAGPL